MLLYVSVCELKDSSFQREANEMKSGIPQRSPSSDPSGQSFLPLQSFSGCRQTEVSLAQGYLGGPHKKLSQSSSSD